MNYCVESAHCIVQYKVLQNEEIPHDPVRIAMEAKKEENQLNNNLVILFWRHVELLPCFCYDDIIQKGMCWEP